MRLIAELTLICVVYLIARGLLALALVLLVVHLFREGRTK